MTTQYTHTVTIACPSAGMADANCLALLLGESEADINTFRQVSYTKDGTDYAVTHTVVKPVFLEPTQTNTLPDTPTHAEGIVDRTKAQAAFDSVNQPGGILLAVDVDPHIQFANWGLTRIPTEEEI